MASSSQERTRRGQGAGRGSSAGSGPSSDERPAEAGSQGGPAHISTPRGRPPRSPTSQPAVEAARQETEPRHHWQRLIDDYLSSDRSRMSRALTGMREGDLCFDTRFRLWLRLRDQIGQTQSTRGQITRIQALLMAFELGDREEISGTIEVAERLVDSRPVVVQLYQRLFIDISSPSVEQPLRATSRPSTQTHSPSSTPPIHQTRSSNTTRAGTSLDLSSRDPSIPTNQLPQLQSLRLDAASGGPGGQGRQGSESGAASRPLGLPTGRSGSARQQSGQHPANTSPDAARRQSSPLREVTRSPRPPQPDRSGRGN